MMMFWLRMVDPVHVVPNATTLLFVKYLHHGTRAPPCFVLEVFNQGQSCCLRATYFQSVFGPALAATPAPRILFEGENVSPAPTTATLQPMAGDVQRSFETLGFDDANWEINPGEAAALAALGLLAALTFFPICSK